MRIKKEYAISFKYWILAIAVFSVLYFGGRGLTGFAALSLGNAEFVSVNKEFLSSENIEVPLDNLVNISGMSISGKYLGKGTVKVFLEAENNSYLIYEADNSQPEEPSGSGMITGLAVLDESAIDSSASNADSSEAKSDSSGDASGEASSFDATSSEKPADEKTEAASADETADSTLGEPSDSNQEAGFEAPAAEDANVVLDEPTTQTADDVPIDGNGISADAPIQLPQEEVIIPEENPPSEENATDGSSENDQEIPANESIDAGDSNETDVIIPNEGNETDAIINDTTEINQTEVEIPGNETEVFINETNIPVNGSDEIINETIDVVNDTETGNTTDGDIGDIPIPLEAWENFINECDATCSLKISTDRFKLRVEITGNINFRLTNISYILDGKIIPNAPALIKNMPMISIAPGGTETINFEEYFSGNNLKYSVDVGEGARVRISGNSAVIRPVDNFFGNARITFSASNDFGSIDGNEVIISVNDPQKEKIMQKLYELFPAMKIIDAVKENNLYSFVLKLNDTEIRISGIKNESDVMGNITTGVISQEITI